MRRAFLLLACAVVAFGVLVPTITEAQEVGFPYYGGLGGGEPLIPCTGFGKMGAEQVTVVSDETVGTSASGEVLPQCTSICDVFVLLNRLIVLAVTIMVTIITPVFLFLGGALVFLSGGNPSRRQQAMQVIKGTMVGLVIVLCSTLLVGQMLFVIFNQTWGDALKERVASNPDSGFTAEQVDGMFSWDNIACTVTAGGIKFSPYDPRPATGGTTPNTTINSPTAGTAIPATCVSNDPKIKCALGFVNNATIKCATLNAPRWCRDNAAAGLCYKKAEVDLNLFQCQGGWKTDTQLCGPDKDGTQYRLCAPATR